MKPSITMHKGIYFGNLYVIYCLLLKPRAAFQTFYPRLLKNSLNSIPVMTLLIQINR